jgi:calmodulin
MDQFFFEYKFAEFREAFKLFDLDGNKELDLEELEKAMNEMGQFPSYNDLKEILKEANNGGSPTTIKEDDFLRLMADKLKENDMLFEIKEAFKLFDKEGNGLIDINVLKKDMLGLGEKLNEAELGLIIKAADTDNDGYINYEDFIKSVFNI